LAFAKGAEERRTAAADSINEKGRKAANKWFWLVNKGASSDVRKNLETSPYLAYMAMRWQRSLITLFPWHHALVMP
jgi:hypothetical protein